MTSFDDEFLRKSQERVSALQERFSQGALEDLAREVMTRMAKRGQTGQPAKSANPEPADIDALCHALVAQTPMGANAMMMDLQAEGYSLDLLYSRYLAPAAERLGAMWDTDDLTFIQVTLGVGRIYDLVRLLRDQLPPTRITRAEPVLFASVPGDQHGVGIEMAAELFRQHGWDVRLLVGASHDQILAEIDRVACLVLGLSSGGRETAEALARLIHAVRVVHPKLYIIVSGRIVLDEPDLVDLIGPDSVAATVDDALATMERLLGDTNRVGC
ncbi:cobalamin B12-binding domain-containing protein [Lacimonas salitolerans]|uniref:B12-binding domain-containing protein n=1 Tax=Lacimonas salitolerans TaxID=1323750 RepID=A0ABW4EN12_9RHOB